MEAAHAPAATASPGFHAGPPRAGRRPRRRAGPAQQAGGAWEWRMTCERSEYSKQQGRIANRVLRDSARWQRTWPRSAAADRSGTACGWEWLLLQTDERVGEAGGAGGWGLGKRTTVSAFAAEAAAPAAPTPVALQVLPLAGHSHAAARPGRAGGVQEGAGLREGLHVDRCSDSCTTKLRVCCQAAIQGRSKRGEALPCECSAAGAAIRDLARHHGVISTCRVPLEERPWPQELPRRAPSFQHTGAAPSGSQVRIDIVQSA